MSRARAFAYTPLPPSQVCELMRTYEVACAACRAATLPSIDAARGRQSEAYSVASRVQIELEAAEARLRSQSDAEGRVEADLRKHDEESTELVAAAERLLLGATSERSSKRLRLGLAEQAAARCERTHLP